MAEFKIDGRMKVKTLKEKFKEEFGGTLRVYNGNKTVDYNATIASIRKNDDAKGGERNDRNTLDVGIVSIVDHGPNRLSLTKLVKECLKCDLSLAKELVSDVNEKNIPLNIHTQNLKKLCSELKKLEAKFKIN